MGTKTLRGRPSDHPYLHKDFHGALSYAVEYLEDRFGREGINEFLRRAARNVYHPLICRIEEQGLQALKDHWREVFSAEGGGFKIAFRKGELVLEVTKCPAISHMRQFGYRVARHFCETTRIVNEAIAREAGYKSVVDYDQEKSACRQRFWREEEA